MTIEWITKKSVIDASVNFIAKTADGGALEARYVQRNDDQFIAYLSSQTGCSQACRFCHLTQLRQTMMTQVGIDAYQFQLSKVLDYYDALGSKLGRMNVNLMARGEPLLNPELAAGFSRFAEHVSMEAQKRQLEHKINISSIFPRGSESLDLLASFAGYPVSFFWSLYSVNPSFRRRWIPKASDPYVTLSRLREWQAETGREVVIHHALIRGENDADHDHNSIRNFLERSRLRLRLNLVRYNSFSDRTGEEALPESYARATEILGGALNVTRTQIVSRVGMDVSASCGMFDADV